MSFLRRRAASGRAGAQAQAIDRFWAWWLDGGAAGTAAAIDDHQPERAVEQLTRYVGLIDDALAWELGPGSTAQHVLVVTAEGDPDRRAVARRWRNAAPAGAAAGGVWEFSDVRLRAADPSQVTLTVDGATLDVERATASARVEGAHLNVGVHHPQLARLPQERRLFGAFLLLDVVLGEVAVESWLATIDALADPPLDPVPLVGLRSVVDDLVDRFTDADGRPTWSLLEGHAPDGARVVAMAQVPLASVNAPQLDTYVGIEVPFTAPDDGGLPDDPTLASLRSFEAHVTERLGGSGQLVAHETHHGVRLLHTYVDGTTPAADQLRAAVSGWQHGRVRITVEPDAGWDRVRHLRT